MSRNRLQRPACQEALHFASDPCGCYEGAGVTWESSTFWESRCPKRDVLLLRPRGDGSGQQWAGLARRDTRGEEGEEGGPGRAVTRVELAAKGGIYGPQ